MATRTNVPARVGAWVLAALLLLAALPAHAADAGRARQIVLMVYDVSLYTSELDRVMDQAASRGVYGGAGSTAAGRARDRTMTRQTMLAQRDAVLAATTARVAARATDPQIDSLLHMAAGQDADPALVQPTVTIVKSSFEESLWDQLARTARGNSEFPCTKEQKSRCN